VITFLALTAFGCTSDGDDSIQKGSGITGHSEAIEADLTEQEAISALNKMFINAGASEELANCYVDVYESEGLAEEINDLSDLAAVQKEIGEAKTEDAKRQGEKIADCGSNA